MFELFLDNTWDEEGVLWLLVRYFGYRPKGDTEKNWTHLPVTAVYRSCRHQGRLLEEQDKEERGLCCNWQGLSPVLMPLTGLAPASPYFALRAMGRLSFPK